MARRRQDDGTPRHADVGNAPRTEPEFPNLKAEDELDLELHAERALEAGLTPEQAIKHARHDHEENE